MSRKQLSCSFVIKVYGIYNKAHSTFEKIKHVITWKPLFKRKSTFLSTLDLLEAIT